MSTNHPGGNDKAYQEQRIRGLKQLADQAVAGQMISWESDMLSPDERERFWRSVVECEVAPSTSDFQRLTEAGLELPEPDSMDDEQLPSKLWELIGALAWVRVFLQNTNHLSNRGLYGLLWRDTLREEVPILPDGPGSAWHIDLLGRGGESDNYLYLKYYADEDARRQWLLDFPDYEMPVHENPPYDRDRRLQQP